MKAFFLSVVVFCCLLASACTSGLGTQLQYGNIHLYYTTGVNESEARALGTYLISAGFDISPGRKTIQLVKSGDVYQVRMAVNPGVEQNIQYGVLVKRLAGQVSENVFQGAPVEMHICDRYMKTVRVFSNYDNAF